MANKQLFFTCNTDVIDKLNTYYKQFFEGNGRYTKSQFIEDLVKIGICAFETKMKQIQEEFKKEQNKGEN